MQKNIVIGALIIIVVAMGAFIIANVAEAPVEDAGPKGDAGGLETQLVHEFKEGLEATVRAEIGQPIEGYEPFMFMDVFENLVPEDFDGVDASIGHYTFVGGELKHDLEGETMIHSAAGSITEEGIETLLKNVMERLGITSESDAETVLEALNDESTSDDGDTTEPVACTMDAKMCPDGSYVGRVGPNCEFAACPATEAIVCTEEMKQVDVCTQEYAPVCGLVEVQCFTTPCDPVPEEFSNACTACSQGNVISYTEGKCEL